MHRLWCRPTPTASKCRVHSPSQRQAAFETLERRSLLSGSPMHLLGSSDVSTAGPSVAATPSDASFVGGQLWGLEKVKAGSRSENPAVNDVAWDFSTGSTRVTVADIDTGIDYTHPDLYRNVWLNQSEIPAAAKLAATDVDGDGLLTFWDLNDAANAGLVADVNANGRIDGGDVLSAWSDSVDEGSNGYTDDLIGWNFVTRNNNPYDDNGHGSHTAGTIGASANDGGVVGVNWNPLTRLPPSATRSTTARPSPTTVGAGATAPTSTRPARTPTARAT